MTVDRLLTLVILISALLQFQPRLARGADDTAEAKRRFIEGSAAYSRGDFKEAIDLFKAAHRIKQAPELLFNIAQSYRQLKDHENALFFYKSYLRDAGNGPNRTEATKQVAEMSRLLGRERPAPAAHPAATVTNAPPAPPAETPRPVETKPQDERGAAGSPNPPTAPAEPSLPPVAAGGALPATPDAPAVTALATKPTPMSPPPPASSARPTAGWVVTGAGAICLAVGLIEVLAGQSKIDTALSEANSANLAHDPDQYQKASQDLSTGGSQRKLGAVLLAAAGVAVAGGLVLLFGPRTNEAATASAGVTPWIDIPKGSPSSAGFAWSARW